MNAAASHISAETFLRHFEESVFESRDPSLFREVFLNDSKWTPHILDKLERIGKDLGFTGPHQISREFFRLDMAYYSYPDSDPSRKSWNLEVAIEHENNANGWHEEWMKLAHLRAGLKVLISYYESEQSLGCKLKAVRGLHENMRYSEKSEPDANWLLIFGPVSQLFRDNPDAPWLVFMDGQLRRM